ncbi:MAG: NDP-sugar synthase [Acidilobaceae archaeon]
MKLKTEGCSIIITKVLIPVGGLGTRLYPLTVETSKAMIRFANKFLIDFIIQLLAIEGIEEFYLGISGYTNYKALHDHLGSYFKVQLGGDNYKIVRVLYQPNVNTVGNAHSVRVLLDYYKIREPVLVVQCDTLAYINVKDVFEFHKSKEAFMTIVLKEIEDLNELKHFGVAKLSPEGMIRGFVEKPKDLSQAPSNLVNTGIYVLSQEMVDFLLSEEFAEMVERGEGDFGMHVIPKVINKGERVAGYRLKSFWFDVGTPERLIEASLYVIKNFSNELLDVETEYQGLKMQGRSRISKRKHEDLIARISKGDLIVEGDVLLGRHVKLGSRTVLENSVVDNYVEIGDGSRIAKAIIMDRCLIKENVRIENSVIGRHSIIGSGVRIENSVIGDDVVIEDGAVIQNCKIWPHRVVRKGTVCKDSAIV